MRITATPPRVSQDVLQLSPYRNRTLPLLDLLLELADARLNIGLLARASMIVVSSW